MATNTLWDVELDRVEDGTQIILYPEKDNSLVEDLRKPESDNQVFFIDSTGALCSKATGHAIAIDEAGRVVLRHRRPASHFPPPLPTFCYDPQSGLISVELHTAPPYSPTANSKSKKTWVLTHIPQRKPRTFVDDASSFLSSAITSPLQLFSPASPNPTSPRATPDEVFNGDIDLADDDVLEEDRSEEGEVDDHPSTARRLRAVLVSEADLDRQGEKARMRRRFAVMPLRKHKAQWPGHT